MNYSTLIILIPIGIYIRFIRKSSTNDWWNPLSLMLSKTLFKSIFEKLNKDDDNYKDIVENTDKHARIIGLSLIGATAFGIGLTDLTVENQSTLLMINLSITGVMGVAWFVLTFGAIPTKFLGAAMSLTESMCYAFVQSLVTMSVLLASALPIMITLVLLPMLWHTYRAAVTYDTLDLLKAGIDEEALSFFRGNKQLSGILEKVLKPSDQD